MTDLLALVGYLLIASAGVLAIATLGAAPSAAAPVLGLRGYKRHRARRDLAWFRLLEPLVRWVAARVARLPVSDLRATTAARLEAAGDYLGVSADEWLALATLAGAAGLAAGLAMWGALGATPLLLVVLPVAGFMGVFITLDGVAQRRQRDVVRGLPSAIDLVALCTSAGMTFPQAIAEVLGAWPGGETDPLAEELRLIGRQLELGQPRRTALQELARRVPSEEVHDFVAAVTQSEQKGTPLGEVLSTQAAVLRQRFSFDVEERSARAAMKMLVPLVLLLLATFVVVLAPVVISAGEWL